MAIERRMASMPSKYKPGKKQITGKSQKGQELPAMWAEEKSRTYFESRRWPNGPVCPHCDSLNVYRVGGDSHRAGLIECRDCRKQFTVTVNTVMEDSHLPLKVWAMAFHFMTTAKKGMSALQLQRNLGIGSYRTAWFLAHRIREAMRCEPIKGMLKGDVQIDETYVGSIPPSKHHQKGDRKRGRGTNKIPVLALVETSGNAHAQPIDHVDGKTLGAAMRAIVADSARIVTDELPAYRKPAAEFDGGHATVNHGQGEYVRDGLHTNSAEAYFALLKRGIHGSFHHVSRKHLHRYCNEFSFRWGRKSLEDTERRDAAVDGAQGRRLTYRPIVNAN
jgi:transposase-like protein